MDLPHVETVIEFAVGETKPDITLLVQVPPEVSAERLRSRQANLPFVRDHLTAVIIGIIIVSLLPGLFAWFRARRKGA